MTTKIVVNGRFLSRRITGVERYAHEISKRLTFSRIAQPAKKPGQINGNLWEQFVLPCLIKQNEILWSPANAGPWHVRNQIITIHDASVLDHPEWFKPSFAAWTRLSWKILARRVKTIITDSNFSRERLKIHLKIPDEKIHVIHNGVGKPFEPQPQDGIDTVKRKYKLDKPYFLFVGTNEPRKNLSNLIKAWQSLNLKTYTLFIAGGKGNIFTHTSIHANNTAYVSDEELPALYAGATAFISPSFYEGFGLPILEAMACGTPVIASDIAVFRELFNSAVFFINPYAVNEIANAMQKIINDQAFANTLRERGLQWSKKFTWDEAAHKTQLLLESTK